MKLSAYPPVQRSVAFKLGIAAILGVLTFIAAYLAGFNGEIISKILTSRAVDKTAPASGFVVPSLVLALFVAGNYMLLVSCSDKNQTRLVWLELLVLFLAFFYSFDLKLSFIAEKLPFLLTQGVVTTLYVALAAICIAFILALLGAVAKLSENGIAVGVASFYTSFFRGVPLLAQLFLIYLGLPQIGFVVDPVPAGIAALCLCYGAYMTEIFRAGIQSINAGQWEASAALGLTKALAFRKVIMPQAMRLIIPPTGNSFIAMLKDSSLVSVVGVWDLMYVARAQGRSEFRVLEMLITAALIYWILSIILELLQARLERYFDQSKAR